MTQAQYVFIHDALDELILCGETAFTVQNVRVKMNRMSRTISDKGITGYQEQFNVCTLYCLVILVVLLILHAPF